MGLLDPAAALQYRLFRGHQMQVAVEIYVPMFGAAAEKIWRTEPRPTAEPSRAEEGTT